MMTAHLAGASLDGGHLAQNVGVEGPGEVAGGVVAAHHHVGAASRARGHATPNAGSVHPDNLQSEGGGQVQPVQYSGP